MVLLYPLLQRQDIDIRNQQHDGIHKWQL